MPINATNISPIRLFNLTPTKLSDEMMEKLRSFEAQAYQTVSIPADENYAQVVAGGKVIATLTNNGYAITDNAMGDRLRAVLRDEERYEGPELAQHRAEQIARAFGGAVVKAETAQTQSEWKTVSGSTWQVDYAKMEQDGYTIPPQYRQTSFTSSELAHETVMTLLELNGA